MSDMIEIPKFSDAIPAESRDDILRIMAAMTAGGWQVTADGKSRQATQREQFVLALIAHRYGLDPLMGEIYLMGGKPYPAFQALYRAAVARGFRVESRPMTPDEREAFGLDKAEFGFVADAYDPSDRKVGSDFGTACEADVAIARGGGARRIVRIMAATRAERRALNKAMGIASWDPDEEGTIDVGSHDARRGGGKGMAALLTSDASEPAPTAADERQADPLPQRSVEVEGFGTVDKDAPFDGGA